MVDGPVTGRRIKRRTIRTASIYGGAGLLVLAVLAGGIYFFKTSAEKAQQEASQRANTAASEIARQLGSELNVASAMLRQVASEPALIDVFAAADESAIKNLQSEYVSNFLEALNLRFFLPNQYKDEGKPTIGFASLDMLNRAENNHKAVPAEILKPGSEDEHAVLIDVVMQGEKLLGLIHLSMSPAIYNKPVTALEDGNYYLELTQGVGKRQTTLASKGSAGLKKGKPLEVSVAGSLWKVQYWDTDTAELSGESGGLPMMTILAAVGIVGLLAGAFWFLSQKKGLTPRKKKDDGVIYQGAVKAIMEGAHPGMESLVPNLPNLGQTRKINPVSEGMEGDDITRISVPEDVAAAAAAEPVLDISGGGETEPAAATAKPEAAAGAEIDAGIFRAYDIRGIVGETLTKESVKLIGQAIGSEAKARKQAAVVVGRDGRTHGPELSEALAEGIRAAGLDVIDIGMVPTPVLYFATYHLELGSGVMLTGSHNPPEYNGMKIMLGEETLSGEAIKALRERIVNNDLETGQGNLQSVDVNADYVRRISDDIPLSLGNSFKLVVDAGNGVAGAIAPQLYRALGHDVIEMYCDVDGNFPNHHPDPSQPENLSELIERVKKEDADLGFAFDGDGDRLGVVDKEGNIIWPDRQLMLLAKDVLTRNPDAPIIFDVKCSRYLKTMIESCGGKPVMWKTGHSLIKAKLKELNAPLAGEMSGHIFFKERWYGFDDALYTGARMLEVLANTEGTPSEIFDAIPDGISTPELRVKLDELEHGGFMEELMEQQNFAGAEITDIDGVRADFEDGWGLVRPSNTSPYLVLRFEAESNEALQRIQEAFRSQMLAIKSDLELPF